MSSEPRPFWQPKTKLQPQRLAGSHAALVAAAGERLISKYDRAARDQLGELLDHAQLGVGVVVELPAPGKVRVHFADADRLMVCGQPR